MTHPDRPTPASPATDAAAGAAPSTADQHRRFALNTVAGGIANTVKIVIQLVLLPLMAHLLGPAEFGLYALALPTVSFFSVLADAGLGNSLAREDEASTVVWSTAFWVLLGTGVALALIVSGWGVLLAGFAHEPRLSPIMAFLSISFVLITMSVLPMARMTRRGNLVIYAGADVVSTLIGAALAVTLAAAGAGAWSLAVQYVVGFAVRAVILNVAAFQPPTLVFQPRRLARHITTGSAVLGSRLFDFAGRLVENVVFGRSFGAAALGTYTFANQAPRFICEAAQNPVWAALFAHALHAEAAAVEALHRTLVRLLASVLFPAACLLSAAAPTLVELMLGEKWRSAAAFIQILLPVYALAATAAPSGAVLLASDRNAAMFGIAAVSSVARVLVVAAGLWGGPAAVVDGVAASIVLSSLAMFAAPAPSTAASTLRLMSGMLAPSVAAVAGGLVCHGALAWRSGGLLAVALSVLIGGVAYAGLMVILDGRHVRSDWITLRRLVFERRRRAAPETIPALEQEVSS